ncbi:cache domain-containing protein [Rhizobium sp. 21-4511-3d]
MRLKLVAVAMAALAPVVTMMGYNEFAMRQQRSQEVRAQAAQAARQAGSEVERIVEGSRSLLVAITAIPSVRNRDVALCNDALVSLASKVPNVRTIFVLTPEGSLVCGSAAVPAGATFADRDYFQAAIRTQDFVVGTFTKSRIAGTPVLPLAMPLVENGQVKAVIVTGIRLDWLQSRIEERGIARGNAVTLADGNGTIVARVPYAERFVGTVIPDEYQHLIHSSEPGVLEVRSQDGTRRVLGYRPIALPGSPLYVSAGFSTDEAFAPINRATINNSIGIAVGAAIAFILSMFIGERFLLSPIARIAGVLERWRRGELDARTRMKGRDELGAVGASLDALLDELDNRRRQSEAANDERALLNRELSHRVKNGFTLVQAIARQTFAKSEPDKYRSFSERLAALANTYDIILLREGSSSSIRKVLCASLRAHVGDGDERMSLQGPEVVLPADVALPLSLVIHELATNATKYGSLSCEEGRVDVDWREEDRRVEIRWRESGGPVVAAPSHRGFGSILIERAFPAQARALTRSDYREDGLVFEMTFASPGLGDPG